jgi:AbrB family looped-hinge helix DNA binding protein
MAGQMMMANRKTPAGFGETTQANFYSQRATVANRERVKLGDGGRFVIPAAMREAMGVKPGDQLIMHVEDGELRVRNWRDALRRVQEKAKSLKSPGESVVDEFLKERREEQERSDERFDRLHAEGMAMKIK